MARPSRKPTSKRKQSSPASNSRKRNARSSSSTSRRPKKLRKTNVKNVPVTSTPSPPTSSSSSCEPLHVIKHITPTKSPHDGNSYAVLTLSNGLIVTLISRHRPSSSTASRKAPCSRPLSFLTSSWPVYLPQWSGSIKNILFSESSYYSKLFCGTGEVDDYKHTEELMGDHETFNKNPAYHLHSTCPDCHLSANKRCTSLAVVVNIGGSDDPIDCLGLAHFTEHMVHYGSKRHPHEHTHDNLIKTFGNATNAHTHWQSTIYFFEMDDILLEQSCDVFSDMLSHPLFVPEQLDLEVNSVDDEFQLRRGGNQIDMLFLPVYLTVDKTHPLAKFTCGTIDTLGSGERVEGIMREFHQKNYVASAMTACINSTKPLKELEDLALDYFSRMLNGNCKTFKETEKPQPVNWRNGDKKAVLQGVTSSSVIDFWWHFPTEFFTAMPQEMVLEVLRTILSDTSNRSLYYGLREKGLVMTQSVQSFPPTIYATFIRLRFQLSKKGQENSDEICQATFQFLKTILTTPEPELRRLFEELRLKHLQKFHFGIQYPCVQDTIRVATVLQCEADEKDSIINGSWANAQFNYERIIECIQYLQNENNLFVFEVIPKELPLQDWAQKNHFKNVEIQVAPHTNSPYILVPRKKTLIADSSNFRFGLIPKNKFLMKDKNERLSCGDCDLIPPANYGNIKETRLEWKWKENKNPRIFGVHLGHKPNTYCQFLSSASIYFYSQTVFKNTRNHTLARLWTYCIDFNHETNQKELSLGGYQHAFICDMDSISVNVGGFPNHMLEILEESLDSMLRKPISEHAFSLAKERLRVDVEKQLGDNDVLERTAYDSMLFQRQEMFADALEYVDSLILTDLNIFIEVFKQTTYAFVELQGNLPVSMLGSTAKALEKYQFCPYFGNSKTYTLDRPVLKQLFPPGEKCVRLKSKTMSGFVTTVKNCYVLGPLTPSEILLLKAALKFMESQALIFLRYKHQLGYHTEMYPTEKLGSSIVMFGILVKSTAKKFSPCEVDRKIDEFLEYFCEYLKTITEDRFEMMRKIKGIPSAVSLCEVVNWFGTVFGPQLTTDKWNQTKSSWFSTKYRNRDIRKLSIQVIGNEAKECNCAVCQSISDWTTGPNPASSLLFAKGSGQTRDYFEDKFY